MNVPTRRISPLLVPSVSDLQRMLCQKYKETNGNKELFVKRQSVIEIGKLLIMYHLNYETVQLNKNVYFCPCKNTYNIEDAYCKYFSV